jgi:hypothetical protein
MEPQTFYLDIPIDNSENSEDFDDCGNVPEEIEAHRKRLEQRKLRVTVTDTGIQFALVFHDGVGILQSETPARAIMDKLYWLAITDHESIIVGS